MGWNVSGMALGYLVAPYFAFSELCMAINQDQLIGKTGKGQEKQNKE